MLCETCKYYCHNEEAIDCPGCGTAFPESLESKMRRAIANIAYNQGKTEEQVKKEVVEWLENQS